MMVLALTYDLGTGSDFRLVFTPLCAPASLFKPPSWSGLGAGLGPGPGFRETGPMLRSIVAAVKANAARRAYIQARAGRCG